jgi:hypothetical protein
MEEDRKLQLNLLILQIAAITDQIEDLKLDKEFLMDRLKEIQADEDESDERIISLHV